MDKSQYWTCTGCLRNVHTACDPAATQFECLRGASRNRLAYWCETCRGARLHRHRSHLDRLHLGSGGSGGGGSGGGGSVGVGGQLGQGQGQGQQEQGQQEQLGHMGQGHTALLEQVASIQRMRQVNHNNRHNYTH
jgi:hypothetical protein